jgi:hypothetical protein
MMAIDSEDLKVLCALSHGLYEPWLGILEQGQQKTWLVQDFPDGFELIHFHGTPGGRILQILDRTHEKLRWKNRWIASALRVLDNILLSPLVAFIPRYERSRILTDSRVVVHIRFPDTYLTYRWKFLALLKYFLNETDADFLLVTSTASYVQPKLVLEYVRGLPDQNTYVGAEPYQGANFVSGSNRIVSREIAKQVLKNRRRWAIGVIEDVALTNLIKSMGNDLITFPIINIGSLDELDSLTDEQLSLSYHFRLKSFQGENRMDATIMKKLHSRIMGGNFGGSNGQ